MTVAELIAALQAMPLDLPVFWKVPPFTDLEDDEVPVSQVTLGNVLVVSDYKDDDDDDEWLEIMIDVVLLL